MISPKFSTPEVSGNDDVLAVLPSGDVIAYMRYQCFDRGCIFKVLRLSGSWNTVLAMMRSCYAQKLRSLRLLSLMCPTPCFAMMLLQTAWLFPVLALNSPSKKVLSVLGIQKVQRVSSTQKASFTSSAEVSVGA